ncbi:MAG TPA: DinB family protein [Thermoanaerobaculia bacterium]|nr:DinB family protein [Thermoanaerobaculia bacterium]
MMDALRRHLVTVLEGKGAHAGFDDSFTDVPANLRGTRPKGADHSLWDLLEHMRIAQWDILDYMRNPKYVAPKWPEGYWPKTAAPANEQEWEKSIESFRRDLRDVIAIVEDESNDLTAPLKYGDPKHTILREALLIADHNSYHLGQFVLVRKLLHSWA